MNLRTLLMPFVPPVAVAAVRTLAAAVARRPKRVRLNYGDLMLECDSSHHLPHILAVWPDFGRPLAEIVLALQVKSARVIDVGANIGDTALLLARFVPGAELLCIEGDPRFMPDLALNTAPLTGITIAEAILGDHTGRFRGRFGSRTQHGGTAQLRLDPDGDAFDMYTLDDLLVKHPEFARPDVIKIDTDGYDAAILRGSARTLLEAKPVAFYEWDPYSYELAGENDFSHAEFLMEHGYDRFLIFTNTGQLLLRVQKPGHEVWESLAAFSRSRAIVGWHYDVAAFPAQRHEVFERLWCRYAEPLHRDRSGSPPAGLSSPS